MTSPAASLLAYAPSRYETGARKLPPGHYAIARGSAYNDAQDRGWGSLVKRVIRAVVSLDPSQINRYKIVYWNENISDL